MDALGLEIISMDTVISPSVMNWEFISYNTWILVNIFTMVCLGNIHGFCYITFSNESGNSFPIMFEWKSLLWFVLANLYGCYVPYETAVAIFNVIFAEVCSLHVLFVNILLRFSFLHFLMLLLLHFESPQFQLPEIRMPLYIAPERERGHLYIQPLKGTFALGYIPNNLCIKVNIISLIC